jgi:enoyl-CoA hydratase
VATVDVERRGPVALVWLNRTEMRNAIDAETAKLLHDAFTQLAGDDEVRVLVVAGRGGQSFSSGADLRDGGRLFAEREDPTSGPLQFSGVDVGKPTIAAVEGFCLAGGLELACWCDFRIAGEGSQFGVVNRRWGIPLVDGGTQRLPRIVGLGTALWLIETGVQIDAARSATGRAGSGSRAGGPRGGPRDRAFRTDRRVPAEQPPRRPRVDAGRSRRSARARTGLGRGTRRADGLGS